MTDEGNSANDEDDSNGANEEGDIMMRVTALQPMLTAPLELRWSWWTSTHLNVVGRFRVRDSMAAMRAP